MARKASPKRRPLAKPRVFVGSSGEAKRFVEELCSQLNEFAEPHPWYGSPVFSSMHSTLADLLGATVAYDFGLFILTPDDLTVSRKKTQHSVRDNVLFELGLFLGVFGTARTIGIMQHTAGKELKIPSDLLGITLPRFSVTDQNSIFAAVAAVLPGIRRKIEKESLRHGFAALISSWGFDEDAHKFSVSIGGPSAHRLLKGMDGEGFALVIRKEDSRKSAETDKGIAISAVRKATQFDTDKIGIETGTHGCMGHLKGGDKVHGYLLVVPKGADLEAATTLDEMFGAGCRILDQVSWTIQSVSPNSPPTVTAS